MSRLLAPLAEFLYLKKSIFQYTQYLLYLSYFKSLKGGPKRQVPPLPHNEFILEVVKGTLESRCQMRILPIYVL